MPVVDVGNNLFVPIEGEFAATGDGDARLPGERGCPMQRPFGVDDVSLAANFVQVHLNLFKPGFYELNCLSVALESSKLVKRIFEVDIGGVNIVGLVDGEALIVSFEDFQNVHRQEKRVRVEAFIVSNFLSRTRGRIKFPQDAEMLEKFEYLQRQIQ